MQFKDYYDTLGVAKTASAKEIKGAFRRLARKFHPDVNPGDKGAEARFKEINEAYEVLGDAGNRKKYDELGANWRMYEQAQAGSAQSPFGGGEYARAGSGGGFRPMTEEEAAQVFGQGDSPFSDFFRTFFGGGGMPFEGGEETGPRGRRGRTRQGRDLEHPLELSLEDALNGSVQRLAIQQGPETRAVEVRVPPGVTDGSRVRVSGEGERGAGGAGNGDLYLRVQLRPHERFRREGRDLHTRVPLPLTTAVLGGEVEVQTLSGRTVRLRVPATTQNGQVFRLRGHGLPSVGNSDDRGDLYAAMDVRLPASVSPEARQHYEALAALERQS